MVFEYFNEKLKEFLPFLGDQGRLKTTSSVLSEVLMASERGDLYSFLVRYNPQVNDVVLAIQNTSATRDMYIAGGHGSAKGKSSISLILTNGTPGAGDPVVVTPWNRTLINVPPVITFQNAQDLTLLAEIDCRNFAGDDNHVFGGFGGLVLGQNDTIALAIDSAVQGICASLVVYFKDKPV